MDQVKIQAAQAKIRSMGMRTQSEVEKIEKAVSALPAMASAVDAKPDVKHLNTGLLNLTVFDMGSGVKCRITAYLPQGAMITVQLDLF